MAGLAPWNSCSHNGSFLLWLPISHYKSGQQMLPWISTHSFHTFLSIFLTYQYQTLKLNMASSSSRNLLSSVLLMFLFLTFAEGRELLVGGKPSAWKIPSSESDSLNKWAGASRFQIGDSLVWNYDSSKDSVLQVSRNDYETCNTSSPIAAYKDGNTKVKLEKSGAYYFISGAEGHCQKGQKLIVVVMSARSQLKGISPAPSPMEFDGHAVAPTSSAVNLKSGLVVMLGGLMGLALF